MPAMVVIVHDDSNLTAQTKAALEQKGFDVAAFTDPLAALPALENARSADLLITRVDFGPGKPHGVSLALMARMRRPRIKVLFVTRPENRLHTEGVGEYLPAPAAVEDVVAAAERVLSGSRAAPMLIAEQSIRHASSVVESPCKSAPIVRFIRLARQAAERAGQVLQRARDRYRFSGAVIAKGA
jgi:DNA-binding NtrC family response regulator